MTRTADIACDQDLVRQALWYNYDYYKAKGEESWSNNATILKYHVCKSHRQTRNLMLKD